MVHVQYSTIIFDWRAPFVARRCVSQRFALVKETFSGNNSFFFLLNDSPVQRFLFFFQRTKSSNINENYSKMVGKFSFFKSQYGCDEILFPTLPEGKFHQNRKSLLFSSQVCACSRKTSLNSNSLYFICLHREFSYVPFDPHPKEARQLAYNLFSPNTACFKNSISIYFSFYNYKHSPICTLLCLSVVYKTIF